MSIPILPPITKPPIRQDVSLHEILYGPKLEPIDIITTYDEDKFEAFIKEWAFEFLQQLSKKYVQVSHFGGAGDKGRDIVCYKSLKPVKCDVFQCKHYKNALSPGDARLELAKLCYNTHKKKIALPDQYWFVSPHDVTPALGLLLEDPVQMKQDLIDYWSDTSGKSPLCSRLVKGEKILLKGKLLAHVESFDFSIVQCKPMHEVIAEYRNTNLFPGRFGGGLRKQPPPDKLPPMAPTTDEVIYIEALLEAYKDNLGVSSLDIPMLRTNQKLAEHYDRSRERFYCAETIREFAKDSLPPPFTFEAVRESVYDAVVDIEQGDWPCGLTRLNEVTRTAGVLHITDSPLGVFLKPKSLQGICHQLANIKRLKWVH